MILANLLKVFLVPNLAFPSNSIRAWNAHHPKDKEVLYEFLDAYLTNDPPMLLFLPKFKT